MMLPAKFKNVKSFAIPAMSLGALAVPTVTAFATTPSGNVSSDMTSALQTGFGNVQADVISIVTTALPYALVVMGIGLALAIGIKVFKRMASKA